MFVVLLALLIGLIGLAVSSQNQTAPAPDFSELAAPEDSEYDLIARVILPDGCVSFEGIVYTPQDEKARIDDKGHDGEPYSGKANIKVTLMLDGAEHLLLDTTETNISKGQLPDVTIDFTKLDFELAPGVYYGTVTITYADGSIVQKPIEIVVYDSSSGSIGIGYSDTANAYVDEAKVTLRYAPEEATTDTVVKIIALDDNGREILVGQSGRVQSGDVITEIPMEASAVSSLPKGAYQGIMRVYFDSEAIAGATTDLKTDIDISVYVR